jgi:cobalamin biosynthesis Mg chelatase CobN
VFSESDVDSVDTQDHYQEIAGRSAAPERSDSVSDEDTEDEEDASPVVTRRERSSSTTRQSVVKAARRRVRASGPVEVERNLYNDEDEEGDEYRPEDEDEEKAEEAHPGLAVRLPFIVLVALLFMLISAAVIWQRGGAIAMLNAIDVANPVAMGLIGVLSGAIASESSIMKPAVVKICNTVFSKA